MDSPPNTYLIDIDGTLCRYHPDTIAGIGDMEVLPGVIDKLRSWWDQGCQIVLTTGRDWSRYNETRRQLSTAGIPYNNLVMGLGGGLRVLINDQKPDMPVTAKAYNLVRNAGIGGVDE